MGAVAKGCFGGVFALAPPNGFFLGYFEFDRLQAGALVCAVAERLVGRAAAGAPPISAGLHFKWQGFVSAGDGLFGHGGGVVVAKGRSLGNGNRKNARICGCVGVVLQGRGKHGLFCWRQGGAGFAHGRGTADESQCQPTQEENRGAADKIAEFHQMVKIALMIASAF